LYWDDFERRSAETAKAISEGEQPPVRRVSIFITEKCNFSCSYCNSKGVRTLSKENFEKILGRYGDTAIIHITGGEPSIVSWLYPFLRENENKYRFHLNTNAYIEPPASSVRRLKISLDHCNPVWDETVGRKGAFNRVVENIKKASKKTFVSVTYTLTSANYHNAVKFAEWSNNEFPDLYAVFFSVYKGTDPRYVFSDEDADDFFNNILPGLKRVLPKESLSLIVETIDEKKRIMQGIRFPENVSCSGTCYLSISERVFSPDGEEYTCSHLYRDGVFKKEPSFHEKCRYGCNRRLVMFNEEVKKRLLNG